MTVLNGKDIRFSKTEKKTAVALGSFDALHKGHIKVISAMKKYAENNNLLAVVQLVDIPNVQKINSDEKKLEILQRLGVDVVLKEDFTTEFKSVKYDNFVAEYIAERYNAAAVFSGENYRFGHMAEGDIQKLSEECGKYGIQVFTEKCVRLDNIVSSTEIRRFVTEGQMEKVIEYMGRPFSVSGEVVHGRELGRTIGFPTANINLLRGFVVPMDGVYLSKVLFDESVFFGITNVGAKPTVEVDEKNIETYISDYRGNLYGKKVEIQFLRRIRDIQKFESLDSLQAQLMDDEKKLMVLAEEEKKA
ncbi:MAG: riboflavin biosynthesis protein RibF [Ruminococcaceae bacterium]|nr:riboflavin biosynthesis protein RibF [Oscillospiraceae bacterium]